MTRSGFNSCREVALEKEMQPLYPCLRTCMDRSFWQVIQFAIMCWMSLVIFLFKQSRLFYHVLPNSKSPLHCSSKSPSKFWGHLLLLHFIYLLALLGLHCSMPASSCGTQVCCLEAWNLCSPPSPTPATIRDRTPGPCFLKENS